MVKSARWIAAAAAGMALMLSGCSESTEVEGTWGATAEASPQLVLAGDGTLTGTDGCNVLNGSWELEGNTVEFGPMLSTQMFCDGVDTWLSLANTATVDGSTMRVMNVEGTEVGTLEKQDS
ncbi:META domain-containing protein [Demequina aurantiaca]|uniref:META domain-containing protein n=1 Tax=Demequina aurantiaca TaxID=676200 RepID=UPI003D354399